MNKRSESNKENGNGNENRKLCNSSRCVRSKRIHFAFRMNSKKKLLSHFHSQGDLLPVWIQCSYGIFVPKQKSLDSCKSISLLTISRIMFSSNQTKLKFAVYEPNTNYICIYWATMLIFFPFNVKHLFLNECNIFVNRYIFIKWFINISIDIDVCNKVSSIQSIFDFGFEGNRFETMKIHKWKI